MLRNALARTPATPQDLTRRFKGAPRGKRMVDMLAALAALGQARAVEGRRFVA